MFEIYATMGGVIEAMLSSTVDDLLSDRTAVATTLEGTSLVRLTGLEPVAGPSYSGSGYLTTIDLARSCHLYILIMGSRYGFVSEQGKSATELEYDAACKADPTKVLVFRRRLDTMERRQARFARRVGEYQKGYYIREYAEPEELGELARMSFQQWLQERAALGRDLNYFDHFVRCAIQRSPFPDVRPTYVVSEDRVELSYRFLGRLYSIHFDKRYVYHDFWGSIALLERRFENWREDHFGQHS